MVIPAPVKPSVMHLSRQKCVKNPFVSQSAPITDGRKKNESSELSQRVTIWTFSRPHLINLPMLDEVTLMEMTVLFFDS